ncbi:tail fiber assembly protein [Escherichia coli]|uniref:tail fiber assembly protein n=1 Tax=Escherichia coli TaxID=562 RepID=UPI000F9D5C97|nr:tail fiber assembly protein [Escherichia coli]EJE0176365.1 tail fiber assembly protein [Escherichia coli]MLY50438.1 tail fiber assembly protein [Escherichia albertii]HBN1753243.1 tail fiber assembly protein [Escherichia coli]HBN2270971.1 tail fiber assembly protein [Escherichia coli]
MRHFDPVTKTEAIEGIHNLENTVELPDDHWFFTYERIPEGKMLDVSDTGEPILIDVPQPTHEELVAFADAEKQERIDLANEYMNSKQWAGKAAIGRLKGEELAQYNLWLDYLDALELVDTSSAPDIEWPTPPAVQAR